MKKHFKRHSAVAIATLALLITGCTIDPVSAASVPAWQYQPNWGLQEISQDADGGYGNAINGGVNGWSPVVSGNGRYVVYISRATNMVPGVADANGYSSDAILYDRLTGAKEYAGIGPDGQQFWGNNYAEQISYDGRYILLNSEGRIYLRDRQAATTQELGVGFYAGMSSDARYITFTTNSNDLIPGGNRGGISEVVMLDRSTGQTELVSQRNDGSRFPTFSYSGIETTSKMSSDGRYVVFYTRGDDPSLGDTNGQDDIYIRDRMTGTTIWASRTAPANYGCQSPTFASGGRYVAYNCSVIQPDTSSNIVVLVTDLATGETTLGSVDDAGNEISGVSHPSMSSDGRYLGFYWNGNDAWQVAIRDRQTGRTAIATQNVGGYGYHTNFSADNKWVVFDADAFEKGGAVYVRPLPFNASDTTYTEVIPDTPVGLTAVSPTKTPALSWSSVSGADHYLVYRGDSTTPVGSSSGTAFTDNSTLVDGDYSYKVSAVSTGGTESAPSSPITVSVDNSPPAVTALTWAANPLLQGQSTELYATVPSDPSGVVSVTYSLNGATPQPMTFDSSLGVWKVTLGSNLGVDTYDVSVVATDAAGNASLAKTDILAVYNAANGYVTGHEWILPGGADTLPMARDTSNNPAKIVAGFTNLTAATSTTPTSGSFDVHYIVKQNRDEFSLSCTSVDWLVVPDTNHASILGHADLVVYIDGQRTVVQNVAVRFDLTLGQNGDPDHVTIKIFNPGLNPATDTATWTINDNALPNVSQLKIKA